MAKTAEEYDDWNSAVFMSQRNCSSDDAERTDGGRAFPSMTSGQECPGPFLTVLRHAPHKQRFYTIYTSCAARISYWEGSGSWVSTF